MITKVELVQFLGIILFLTQFGLLFWIFKKGKDLLPNVKRMAFAALIVCPVLLGLLGNFYVFDHSKTTQSCSSCHVMKPMVNDMQDPESMTLAARHFKNNWISENECYSCHTDYGLNGTFKAKLDGYRHLMRYITSTYEEPIISGHAFSNANCNSCHSGTESFESVDVHQPLLASFSSNEVSCLNCHGRAHPTRLQRTPGSVDYEKLMTDKVADEKLKAYLQSITPTSETKPSP
ncbi:MAG: hypothetical protein MJA30_29360 [Cytophagales bacterium]|nr:hypothetical protein [Cytophagales bacterium]